MSESIMDFGIVAAVIIVVSMIIVFMDRRSRKAGTLSIAENQSNGTGKQPGRWRRFFKTYSLILLAAIAIVFVARWAYVHPSDPLTRSIAIGTIILCVVFVVLEKVILVIKYSRKK